MGGEHSSLLAAACAVEAACLPVSTAVLALVDCTTQLLAVLPWLALPTLTAPPSPPTAISPACPRPQTATSRAVEVHELSRSVDGGGQILPLSEGMLHQLLKSALAMEIDATGEVARQGLAGVRWQAVAVARLGGSWTGRSIGCHMTAHCPPTFHV